MSYSLLTLPNTLCKSFVPSHVSTSSIRRSFLSKGLYQLSKRNSRGEKLNTYDSVPQYHIISRRTPDSYRGLAMSPICRFKLKCTDVRGSIGNTSNGLLDLHASPVSERTNVINSLAAFNGLVPGPAEACHYFGRVAATFVAVGWRDTQRKQWT